MVRLKSVLSGPFGRYLLSSGFNVFVHQVVLQLGLVMWQLSGRNANAVAAVSAALPAFLICRYWVWQVSGKASLLGEIVPFWLIAVAGLIVSTTLVTRVDTVSSNNFAIAFASFSGYLIVWVSKYLILNLVFNRARSRAVIN